MATIQQRRQALSPHHSETDPEEEFDWHVVASVISSSSSPAPGSGNLSRPQNSPSLSSSVLEFESDALLTTTDDDESLNLITTSDFENISIHHPATSSSSFAALPLHDGEGNFGASSSLSTDDDLEQNAVPPRRTRSRVHLPIKTTTTPQSPGSDSPVPNLLLPGAGLPPPNFARAISGPGQPLRFSLGRRKTTITTPTLDSKMPQFRPTIIETPPTPPRSTTPTSPGALQQGQSEVLGELGYLEPSSFSGTHASRDSLDQNPMHHPTFLTTLWQHLYRIAADLLVDAALLDSTTLSSSQTNQQYYPQPHCSLSSSSSFTEPTSVIDRILLLAREARDEGFLPFGSHMLGSGFAVRRGSFTDIPSTTMDDWTLNGGIKRCQSEVALEWTEEGPRREKRKDRRRERERPRSVIVG